MSRLARRCLDTFLTVALLTHSFAVVDVDVVLILLCRHVAVMVGSLVIVKFTVLWVVSS